MVNCPIIMEVCVFSLRMGGIESKFNSLLVSGRTEEAVEMWGENLELQARHQPNAQIKASPYRDTPLHCTVRHEMMELMKEFLTRGGNPFSLNGDGETPLHIVCRSAKASSRKSKRRAEFLRAMLERVPMEGSSSNIELSSSSVQSSLEGSKGWGLSFSGRKGLLMSGKEQEEQMMNGRDSFPVGDGKEECYSVTHNLGTQDKVGVANVCVCV